MGIIKLSDGNEQNMRVLPWEPNASMCSLIQKICPLRHYLPKCVLILLLNKDLYQQFVKYNMFICSMMKFKDVQENHVAVNNYHIFLDLWRLWIRSAVLNIDAKILRLYRHNIVKPVRVLKQWYISKPNYFYSFPFIDRMRV
jgi:hypothetical protein